MEIDFRFSNLWVYTQYANIRGGCHFTFKGLAVILKQGPYIRIYRYLQVLLYLINIIALGHNSCLHCHSLYMINIVRTSVQNCVAVCQREGPPLFACKHLVN